jgi:exopolysaccharide biosynthesis protein
VVRRQRLAVAVNACLFTSDSGWVPLPGDLARSVETVVADRQANHLWEHTYLLWFDDELTPTLETTKPPSEDVLSRARWGVGGQGVGLREGRPRPGQSSEQADARTAVGIDRERRLLFLAVFESATPWRALDKLAALGAREGMLLDGGSSTSMVLGDGASGVRSGSLMGGWRPVATHFGVRARPLPPAAPSSG